MISLGLGFIGGSAVAILIFCQNLLTTILNYFSTSWHSSLYSEYSWISTALIDSFVAFLIDHQCSYFVLREIAAKIY